MNLKPTIEGRMLGGHPLRDHQRHVDPVLEAKYQDSIGEDLISQW